MRDTGSYKKPSTARKPIGRREAHSSTPGIAGFMADGEYNPAKLTRGRELMSVTYETARAGMKLIRDGAISGDLAEWGIAPEHWELITGTNPWLHSQLMSVKRGLDTLIHATMDAQGLPRFDAPAEYIAAVISIFVGAPNAMPACRLMEARKSADELASTGLKRTEDIEPSRLFALVIQMYGDNMRAQAIADFEKRTNLRIQHALETGAQEKA